MHHLLLFQLLPAATAIILILVALKYIGKRKMKRNAPMPYDVANRLWKAKNHTLTNPNKVKRMLPHNMRKETKGRAIRKQRIYAKAKPGTMYTFAQWISRPCKVIYHHQ